MKNKYIFNIVELIDDDVAKIRENSYDAMLNLS